MMDEKERKEAAESGYYQRLKPNEVYQHNIMWVSFVFLVATGFMSQIPHEWVEAWFGPYRNTIFTIRGYVHRTFGCILAGVSVWHLWYVTMTKDGRGAFIALMPKWRDLPDMKNNIRFMLGREKHRPKFDRFDYREKMEYIFGALGTALINSSSISQL
jgi:cytochrome b subunit of formate dehydrogenase